MSDDKTKTGGRDRTRISLSEDYEVRDWAKKFGVTVMPGASVDMERADRRPTGALAPP